MPLFAKESMKRLPPKLRNLIRIQNGDEARGGDGGLGATSPEQKMRRPLSRGGASLRRVHHHVDQDERAIDGRKGPSRPTSAIRGRRNEIKGSEASRVDAVKAVEELVSKEKHPLRRTASAPNIGDLDKAKYKMSQKALGNTKIMGSSSSLPNSPAASPTNASSPDSKLAAKLLGGVGGALKRSGTARQLTRRRSSISLGQSGGKRSKSRQKREQVRRDERRAVQAKLRSVLGKMTHRKLSNGWAGWTKFVQDHRYRDLSSAAQSVLMHVEPADRKPDDLDKVESWIRQMKLDCFRPLTDGLQRGGPVSGESGSGGGLDAGSENNDANLKSSAPNTSDGNLLSVLCRRALLKKYKKGEIMFWQTDFGDHYHVVLQGQVGIYANAKRTVAAKTAKEAKLEAKRNLEAHSDHRQAHIDWSPDNHVRNRLLGKWIVNYDVGGAFGELALVSWDRERKASAIANEDDTLVLLLDRWSYNNCLWHLHQATHNLDERVAWLKTSDLFSKWNQHRLAHFAYSLKEKDFNRGDVIVHEGDPASQLIILKSGEAQSYICKKDVITGASKLLRLATYNKGSFLGETDLSNSSSKQRTQPSTIRAMSSASTNQVTCYYVPRETYTKFVLKNNDAASSLLRRQLVTLSAARRQHIRAMNRRFQVAQKIGAGKRTARVPVSHQLREIEKFQCGQAPVGMPQNVRVLFGKILLTMTSKEREDVMNSCEWSKPTDISDAELALKRESKSKLRDEKSNSPETNDMLQLRPQTSPLKAARKKSQIPNKAKGNYIDLSAEKKADRLRRRREAEVHGTQYGKSRHAVDNDDMWGLLSDAAVLTTSISNSRTESSPRNSRPQTLAPIKSRVSPLKRPSTAPNVNPFGIDSKARRQLRLPGRLSVGLCSPSFYGGRAAVSIMKKKILQGIADEAQPQSDTNAKRINAKIVASKQDASTSSKDNMKVSDGMGGSAVFATEVGGDPNTSTL